MKKLFTLLLWMVSMQLIAQNYPITANISFSSNPDPNMANWGTGTSALTISASTPPTSIGKIDSRVMESKISVIIKKNGVKFCGTSSSSSAPSAGFNTATKVWSGKNAVSLIGQECVLPPGEYEICVQFFGYSLAVPAAPLSEEKCKSFIIPAKEQLVYQPPQLINPSNGTVFSQEDIKKPITFRWTPVVPKPQEPVTYRLKVWQLMQGQNGSQAMTTNQPVITKDIDNLTQTVVNNLISGPCLSPYLCDFVWNVQALNTQGKPIGGNNGMSELFKFNFSSPIPTTASCGNISHTDIVLCKGWNEQTGMPIYSISVNLTNTPTSAIGCNAKYNSIIIVNGGGSISSVNTLPLLITPNNNGTVNFVYSPSSLATTSAKFRLNGNWSDAAQNTIDEFVEVKLPSCICKDCDRANVNFENLRIIPSANNTKQFVIGGNVNVNGLPGIYGIEFQIQSFSYGSSPNACSEGVTGIEQSGMFLMPGTTINQNSAIQLFNESISGSSTTNNNASKCVKFISNGVLPNSIPVNLLIGLPGPISGLAKDCCKMNYNLCIKVKVYYDKEACKSCVFTYCFPSFSNL